MREFLRGISFSAALLLIFLVLRIELGLWESFFPPLIMTSALFVFYIKNKKLNNKAIIINSMGTGFFYVVFPLIWILLFPVKVTRDILDYIMPYYNAFTFGVISTVTFLFVGFSFYKLYRKKRA